ncbi:MAG: hypothetical protein ACE37J_11095 [Pikeienuella sp.]|uniref:hypothetical protein n=1 Tax=Pikeienuella sp. TaxID=2831957 RepID=UPI003919D573
MRALLAAFLLFAAAPASAAPFGVDGLASPRLLISADGFLDSGFLLITGDILEQPAGLDLSDYEISGFFGDAISLLVFSGGDPVNPAIETRLAATGFEAGRLEFLFDDGLSAVGVFGPRLLVQIEGASFAGIPFVDGFGVGMETAHGCWRASRVIPPSSRRKAASARASGGAEAMSAQRRRHRAKRPRSSPGRRQPAP